MEIFKDIPTTLLFLFIGLITLFGLFLAHEGAHVEVFKDYGIESEIRWTFNLSEEYQVYTKAERPCCTLANNNVDSFGYQLFMVYLMVFAGFIFIIFLMEIRQIEN